MGSLYTVVLSLILTEFFKGAYKVWDNATPNRWPALFTLGACAFFLAKQIGDIYLFYNNMKDYEVVEQSDTRGRLIRVVSGNTIEIWLLFLTYGAVQALGTHNYPDNTIKLDPQCTVNCSILLSRSVGAGLLLSTCLTELTWLIWDLLYLWKRCITKSGGLFLMPRKAIADFKKKDTLQQKSADEQIIGWAQTNFFFSVLFWGLFYRFRNAASSSPALAEVILWLFVPMVVYLLVFNRKFEEYYLGERPWKVRKFFRRW